MGDVNGTTDVTTKSPRRAKGPTNFPPQDPIVPPWFFSSSLPSSLSPGFLVYKPMILRNEVSNIFRSNKRGALANQNAMGEAANKASPVGA